MVGGLPMRCWMVVKLRLNPERFKIVDDWLLVFYDGIWGDTLKPRNDFVEYGAALIGKADQEWESLLDLNNCAALRGARRGSAGEGVSRICMFDLLGYKKAKRRMARALGTWLLSREILEINVRGERYRDSGRVL